MLTRRSLIGACLASPFLTMPAFAGPSAVFAQDGVAIRGVDPVAYFMEGAVVEGSPDEAVIWHGAAWHFSSAANRLHFEMNPRAFAPRYGGYCALALSRGVLTPSEPAAWAIHNRQLYLTHSMMALRTWQRDPATHIRRADMNWPTLLRM